MPLRFNALVLLCSALCFSAPLGAQEDRAPTPPSTDDPAFADPKPGEQSVGEQVRGAQERMQGQIGDAQQRQADEFAAISARMEAQYEALGQRLAAQREQFHKRVAQQWTDVAESSDKTWVDYSDRSDARSTVDFENGEIEVEVLVPIEDVAPQKGRATTPDQLDKKQSEKLRALAEEKLRQQTQRMLAQREPAPPRPPSRDVPPPQQRDFAPPRQEPRHDAPPPEKEPRAAHPAPPAKSGPAQAEPQKAEPHAPSPQAEPQKPEPQKAEPQKAEPHAPSPQAEPQKAEPPDAVLSGQLQGADGKAVTPKDADRFVREELAPKMVVDPKLVVGEDGKSRIRVKVKIPMVPGHLKVRADRYATQVSAQAQKLGIEPSLIFAVIHTESAFNPMARSNAGAFGLMQLIPKQGAHEAYRHLHKTEKVITPEYLYDPDNNIALGATYLEMLQSSFFGKLKSKENRQVLSIASYNCGPTRIKRTVVAGNDVDAMSAEEVVALVRKLAPEETRNYVTRVRERMALYRDR